MPDLDALTETASRERLDEDGRRSHNAGIAAQPTMPDSRSGHLPNLSAQRLLNLVATLAFVATVAAIWTWQQTGDTPPYLLKPFAISAWIAVLGIALIGEQTRPRVMLRFLSALFALIAVIAVIADWSRPDLPGSPLGATTLFEYLSNFTPSMMAATEASVSRAVSPQLWDPIITSALYLPAWLIFALLAAATGYAGRPRREVRIFVN